MKTVTINPLPEKAMSKISQIVDFLEARKSAFAVSRLIMLTGVPVRTFVGGALDEPAALGKILDALPQLLSDEEMTEVHRLIVEPPEKPQ